MTGDPLDPGRVRSGARLNSLSVAMADYRLLWERCQKAEAAVEMLDLEIESWNQALVEANTSLAAAERLAEAATEYVVRAGTRGPFVSYRAKLRSALAAYRATKEEK